MTFKTFNDSIESNDLIFILFVFDVYSWMIELNALFFTINQRITTMKKTINEIKKFTTMRQINNAFNIQNELSTISIHNLSLNLSIFVFWKKSINKFESWKKSYNFIDLKNEQIVLKMFFEFMKFKTILMKSYNLSTLKNFFFDENEKIKNFFSTKNLNSFVLIKSFDAIDDSIDENKIDQNETNLEYWIVFENAFQFVLSFIKRDWNKSKKYFVNVNYISSSNFGFLIDEIHFIDEYKTKLISFQFIASRQKKTFDLIKNFFFKFVKNNKISSKIKIFNFKFVDEIKNSNIKKTFEKSRLMMQTYNDVIKIIVLIQSSIIQQMNQRIILCFVVTFDDKFIKLYFRNVIQTYVQLTSNLNRDFFIKSFHKFVKMMKTKNNCLFKMMKLFYDVFKTNNYWFATYHKHHIKQFDCIESTYNLCFFYNIKFFDLIKLQINDIFILTNDEFASMKNKIIQIVKIMIKLRNNFIVSNSIKFNEKKNSQ